MTKRNHPPFLQISWLLALSTLVFFLNERALGAKQTKFDSRQLADSNEKVANSDLEKLGQLIFNDKNLSNPPGVSCASCHNPEAGYSGSESSEINDFFGVGVGAIPGRYENRNPPTIMYSKYCPEGPPVYDRSLQSYVGGLFRDGHTESLASQIHFPLFHVNEMNDTNYNQPSPKLVVSKLRSAPYAQLFLRTFGANAFALSSDKVLALMAKAIVAFENSVQISPFSSKYDAFVKGKAKLTAEEFEGLELVTGFTNGRPGGPLHKSGQCVICHGIEDDSTKGPDLWTQFCYTNIGVPKNISNPNYFETNKKTNPLGYNSMGLSFVDYGLGNFLYASKGLPAGNVGCGSNGKGDFLFVNGTFKVPTLRNVDKRPNSTFIKAYMHNGVFKNLKDVVHFYNTRNLTSIPGEVIDFTQLNPYAELKGKPLWPSPEYVSAETLINPAGQAGQIGNLKLTAKEEQSIVLFLKTLSDGFQSN